MAITNMLHGSVISPFVRKVVVVLNRKDIAYQVEEVTPFIPAHREKLLKLNPLGKIPIFQEDNFVIADSSVICAYLEKKYPVAPIYPVSPQGFAQCLWYEEYADTQLIPAIITVFFHLVLAPLLRRKPNLNAVKLALEQQLPPIFAFLDQEVADKNYLIDGCFSLADISIATAFLNFEFAGQTIDASRWGNLIRYLTTIYKEKSVEEAFTQAKARFASIKK
ncbi:glutathione S-transferase family protein [Legionella brunensis]|uniref:Stringent starvation protein A n=1 Tax=Legionella brunensis TaxID=29422 RepID=A0A0W0SUP4_9GAMM|nr:glutathione S-transferase family protein [Legionella brunensis]KTC87074.1 stringent starvation protein A [Legionella brunensis]